MVGGVCNKFGIFVMECKNCDKTIGKQKVDISYYLYGGMNYFCDFPCKITWMNRMQDMNRVVQRDFKNIGELYDQ